MKYFSVLVMMGMLGAGCGLAQTTADMGAAPPAAMTDSQTLKAILAEMRSLHNDVRLSQTTQILLTEMEVQRGVVDKAAEKRDQARNRVNSLQMNEKNFATQLEQLDQTSNSTLDPVQQKQIAQQVQMYKANMASMKSQEPDAASSLQDAENTLRKEQDVLDGIQAQLEDVVKRLQPATK